MPESRDPGKRSPPEIAGPSFYLPGLSSEIVDALREMAPGQPPRVVPGPFRPTLILPQSQRPVEKTEMDLFEAFLPAEDLLGHPISENEAVTLVKRIPADWLMTVCSRLLWLVEQNGTDSKLQLQIAADVAGGELRASIEAAIGKGRIAFHSEQLLGVMRLAIEHGSNVPATEWDEAAYREPFVWVAMAVNDLIGADVDREGDRAEDLTRTLMRAAVFSAHEPWANVFARADALWYTIPPTLDDNHRFDIEAEFRCATGVSLEDYLAAGTAVMTRAFGIVTKSLAGDEADWGTWAVDGRESGYFAAAARPADLVQALNLLTGDRERFEREFASLTGRERYLGVGMLPFRRFPFFRLRSGHIVALSGRFLVEGLIQNVFWIIADHLRDAHARDERDRFTRCVGKAFEQHVVDLLRSAYDLPAHQRVFADDELDSRPGTSGAPDAAVFLESIVLFVEATKSELSFERVIRPADLAAFDTWVQDVVVRKARQLRQDIINYRDRTIVYPGGFSDGRRFDRPIWPIIVLWRPIPQFALLTRRVRTALRDAGVLEGLNVEPFILSIQELEAILRPHADKWLTDVLAAHRASTELRDVSLANFAAMLHLQRETVPYLDEGYARTFRRVRSALTLADDDGPDWTEAPTEPS